MTELGKLEKGEALGGVFPPSDVFVGDRFLVGVECVDRRLANPKSDNGYSYIDWQVIVATESGWDTPDGYPWGAWSEGDVSFWAKLPKQIKETSSI